MADIVQGGAAAITNITQILTRNHNDTQNRDAAGAHSILTTGIDGILVAAPAVGEILKYNGTNFINAPSVTANVGPGAVFYLNDAKIIPAGAGPQTVPLETLLKTPIVTGGVDESAVVNNSTALIDQYMYNTALGISSINAGVWVFDTYCYVDVTLDTSEVITSVGKVLAGAGTVAITGAGTSRTATVTGGTPFLAADFNADITQTGYIHTPNAVLRITGFTSTSVVTVETLATYTNEAGVAYSVDRYLFQSTTGDISQTSVGLSESSSVQPAFSINTTDKLSARYYAKTNHVGAVTVHIVHGGAATYTRFLSPLITLHNELPGLQGGMAAERYHLTANQNANQIINKGQAWIAHGDNVITLSTAQSDTNFRSEASIHLPAMGGVTTRGPTHTNPMTITTRPGTTSRLLVRLHGGFGFTSCGFIAAVSGVTERFDDVANTQTGRTAATARLSPAGYSLNGFGFTSGGFIAAVTGLTERFDDVINAHTVRTAASARQAPAGYSLNGFGFTSCGDTTGAGANTGTTERFDDVANTQTGRTAATARTNLSGYGLNGFGFTSCGFIAAVTGTTERFDDVANTQTGRTAATARQSDAGYGLNGFGFTSCGNTGVNVGTTERFDDVANTQTARTAATVRRDLAGYGLNGFGFTSCGNTGVNVGTTERFDDVANTHTARLDATARQQLVGYSTNEYFVNFVTEDV